MFDESNPNKSESENFDPVYWDVKFGYGDEKKLFQELIKYPIGHEISAGDLFNSAVGIRQINHTRVGYLDSLSTQLQAADFPLNLVIIKSEGRKKNSDIVVKLERKSI